MIPALRIAPCFFTQKAKFSDPSSGGYTALLLRQVFWFMDQPTNCAFPGVIASQWQFTAFVPIHSGGTTPDLHRVPSLLRTHHLSPPTF